ncbi:N-acyl-D-amino-acid deacylase family protein [Luteimonas lutimaris]|uniref:D-aminoacylase n=1 Tax=Luteimonas lutimaris TaxID=698645 RepID=A0ABP7MJG1_9GAMM
MALLVAAVLQAGCAQPQRPARPVADIVLLGGTVHDGSADAPRQADVAVVGDRIAYVGPDAASRFRARRNLDVHGRIVAPGFIDPHTHPDRFIRSDDATQRLNAPWLFQGVTTVFIGSDGSGSPDITAQREWFASHGVGTNLAMHVGFGAVRSRVLGQDDRAPSAPELQQMRGLVASAMCEGAFGLSTGLFYAPQSFADTDEVVALAREAALRGGIYDTHQRDESSYGIGLLGSVREVLEIGRRAGIPVHFSHIKALGVDVQGQAADVIALIEQARASGQRVTADQYPWLASGTHMGAALLPRWAVDGGRKALLQRLQDDATRARIRGEMVDNLRRRGGADALLLTGSGWPWTGRTLDEMAREWDIDPVDAALRIISEGGERTGAQRAARSADQVASFNMRKDDVDLFMRQPWVITGSDGSNGHPRQYATFPEKYARYVKRDHVIGVDDFIRRSSGLSADILGLEDTGYLREGYFADIVVLDPGRYAPMADYVHPRELSRGVDHLLVNGQPAILDGKLTGTAAGRVRLHAPTPGTCP